MRMLLDLRVEERERERELGVHANKLQSCRPRKEKRKKVKAEIFEKDEREKNLEAVETGTII